MRLIVVAAAVILFVIGIYLPDYRDPMVERKHKQSGEGHEYILPTGTAPGTVSWARPIP